MARIRGRGGRSGGGLGAAGGGCGSAGGTQGACCLSARGHGRAVRGACSGGGAGTGGVATEVVDDDLGATAGELQGMLAAEAATGALEEP